MKTHDHSPPHPTLALYAADALGDYGFVEKPWYQPGTRLSAFRAALVHADLAHRVQPADAPPASDADLQLVHDADYLAWVAQRCASNQGSLDRAPAEVVARARQWLAAPVPHEHAAWAPLLESEGLVAYDPARNTMTVTDAGRAFLADPDATLGGPTYARARVERAARYVCGAVLDATRRILAGEITQAFVPIAGFHHAHRAAARDYCLYNDPALAIAAALRHGIGPVAYIDIDIHHGDGVFAAFADDPRVVIADLYAHGDTPGVTLHRDAAGRPQRVHLGPGTTDDTYLAAWAEVYAHLQATKPALIVFEAGVDGLAGDPMSRQQLTLATLRAVTADVRCLARDHAGGRLLALGGGGYAPELTARGWTTVVRTLLER